MSKKVYLSKVLVFSIAVMPMISWGANSSTEPFSDLTTVSATPTPQQAPFPMKEEASSFCGGLSCTADGFQAALESAKKTLRLADKILVTAADATTQAHDMAASLGLTQVTAILEPLSVVLNNVVTYSKNTKASVKNLRKTMPRHVRRALEQQSLSSLRMQLEQLETTHAHRESAPTSLNQSTRELLGVISAMQQQTVPASQVKKHQKMIERLVSVVEKTTSLPRELALKDDMTKSFLQQAAVLQGA